jgi:hypothetical protein
MPPDYGNSNLPPEQMTARRLDPPPWMLDEDSFPSGEMYRRFRANGVDRDVAYCLIDLAIRVRQLERRLRNAP